MRPVRDIEGIKQLPALEYPETGSFRCVEVVIPDDDKYLWVLAGFIAILGNSWSWSGERDDRISRAALWKMAYRLTEWAACMNCEEMQECLQPLFDALRQQVNQDAIFRQYGTENPTGTKLPPEAITENQAAGTNPECDYDILWAQSLQVIEYANFLITDALEIAESAANDMELVEVITQLPVIDELGADAIAGYINALQEGLSENYLAQYTSTYRDEAACSLFCLAQEDCEITLERISQVFRTRIETHFSSPMGVLGTIADLFAYFVDRDIDGTIIADFLMLIIWEGGILTNQFLGDVGTKSLQTILQLAVNDANNDWEILCEVCPECGIAYEVTKGTEVDGTGTPAAEEFGVRPTGGGADAYFREIIYEFDEPVITAEFNFAWVGMHDGIFAQLGDGTVVENTADDTGTLTATHPTGATTLIIVGGYAAIPTYEFRYPQITDMNGCTPGG